MGKRKCGILDIGVGSRKKEKRKSRYPIAIPITRIPLFLRDPGSDKNEVQTRREGLFLKFRKTTTPPVSGRCPVVNTVRCRTGYSMAYIRNCTIALFLGVFPLSADYLGGNYQITSIAAAGEAQEGVETDVIKGEVDSTLVPVDSIAGMGLRPGQLLLRRKIHSETYAFYKGTIDTAVFSLSPALYSFRIPSWARLEDILKYRFYRSPTDLIGSDEAIVYFDNERIYTRTCPQLHYFRNGFWFTLTGTTLKPVGSMVVHSIPPDANVLINGNATGLITPCTLDDLLGGDYSVELRLTDYQFFRRTVRVVPDSTVSVSFALIADVDTVFISGDATYSLLFLPDPPSAHPYTVDDSVRITNARIRLSPGAHKLQWTGDGRFEPLDTIIEVPEGKVVYFDYTFWRRFGMIRVIPFPPDAEICIDRFGCATGERIDEIPADLYHVSVFRQGFKRMQRDLHVLPDTITTLQLDLRQVADADGDGFVDSIDGCPALYGLYNGCPKLRLSTAVNGLKREIGDFVDTDSLTFGFSLAGVVLKTPTNRSFRNFLSVFSGGLTGGVNNYRGITFLNSFFAMYRGLFCKVELGQWFAGLQYKRADTLFVDSTHFIYFDSLFNVEPKIYFPSTSVAAGFHYHRSRFDVAYAIGYQWEDIIIDQVFNTRLNGLEQVVFDNDWWFHLLEVHFDLNQNDVFVPSLYTQFKFPFGNIRRTRWLSLNFGLQLKIFTKPPEKQE